VPQLSLCFLHVIRRGTLTVDKYFDSAKRREAVQPQAVAAIVPILCNPRLWQADGNIKLEVLEIWHHGWWD